jgi:membrane protease YdiL (CAAX protease family)
MPLFAPTPVDAEPAVATIAGALGQAALILLADPLWIVLMRIDLGVSPAVPWAAVLMAACLGFLWRFLDGRIGWRRTAAVRHAYLKARGLPGRVWLWAMLAGIPAMASLFLLETHSCSVVPPAAADLPGIGSLSRLPLLTGICFGVVTSAVAALVEEAAFRGYMQSDLERRFRPAVTLLIVALAFAAAHLVFRPFQQWLAGVPAWILISLVFSALVRLTGSIWPAVCCHFAIDVTLFSLDWLQGPFDALRASAAVPHVRIGLLLCVLFGLASLAAFRQLARVVPAGEREGSRSADARALKL